MPKRLMNCHAHLPRPSLLLAGERRSHQRTGWPQDRLLFRWLGSWVIEEGHSLSIIECQLPTLDI